MKPDVALWIDHRRAVILFPGHDEPIVVQSKLAAHSRFTHGSAGHPGGESAQSGESERRREERWRHDLARYSDELLAALGRPGQVLSLGTGEAKHALQNRLEQATARPGGRPGWAIEIEAADHPSEGEIVSTLSERMTPGA